MDHGADANLVNDKNIYMVGGDFLKHILAFKPFSMQRFLKAGILKAGLNIHRSIYLSSYVESRDDKGEVNVLSFAIVLAQYWSKKLPDRAKQVMETYEEILTYFLESGVNPNEAINENKYPDNNYGKTPVYYAIAYSDKRQFLPLLQKYGAKDEEIFLAALWSKGEKADFTDANDLVNEGIKMDIIESYIDKVDLNYVNYSGALHRVQDVELAQRLIAKGADVNLLDAQGNTPLMVSIRAENINMVQMLLASGADKNIKNAVGKDVFDYIERYVVWDRDKEQFKKLMKG